MSTLTYNQVYNFLFNDFKKHQFISDQKREMSKQDVDMVSGGFNAVYQEKYTNLVQSHMSGLMWNWLPVLVAML
jgi:hypothetical protein